MKTINRLSKIKSCKNCKNTGKKKIAFESPSSVKARNSEIQRVACAVSVAPVDASGIWSGSEEPMIAGCDSGWDSGIFRVGFFR